ncbi:M1 family metallopeptidase [Parasediminibacterium sp. JCM 36343]|uniref:M1 family metallopeptidase n=1 Tax=Parasediminibacterium sp. JCM 36343 TaxID=3374279 RepID=UPI00397E1942
MRKAIYLQILYLFIIIAATAQAPQLPIYTKADTLRGSNNANRDWWDVLKYDISVTPNLDNKTIHGVCTITFKVVKLGSVMQIDLQDTLAIISTSIVNANRIFQKHPNITFHKEDGVYLLQTGNALRKDSIYALRIVYNGKPREAVNPPWDGGWVWKKDANGKPWVSVACQGLGASSWYPCKDIQSDEPDSGATLSITTPDSLVSVGNGRMVYQNTMDRTCTSKWQVTNPINNYTIIPYIGKYVNFTDTLMGEGGKLDLSYWVLDYNLEKAKLQFDQAKPMLHCFEYWFGKYPFYEDSYKLVEAPYLGMEHQSAVAYGNGYKNGYHGRDLSGSGWGLKWDFIIVHESGHEWFANSITTKDIADMWVHEGFTNYSEVLYTEWLFGKEAGKDYCVGIRKNILNDKPIIGPYGVNKEGSSDMYYKAANTIQNIRHIINDDSLFRQILRGLNKEFYHQTVTTQQIETYISQQSGINLQKVFDQYLRTTQVPELHYHINKDPSSITLNWANCVDGFNMPITIPLSSLTINIGTNKTTVTLTEEEMGWFNKKNLEREYYIVVIKN